MTLHRIGPGSGVYNLTNGESTGAPIALLYLTNTTSASTLKMTASGGTAPGTTFENLLIDNLGTGGGALGTLSAKGIHLAEGGSIEADGAVRWITLGDIGGSAGIGIGGSLSRFDARTVGEEVQVSVDGDMGNFSVYSMGVGGEIAVDGGITAIKTLRGGLSASINVGKGIKSINVIGGDFVGGIVASGTQGIGKIGGTAAFGAGLGKNRIRIGGEMDGQIKVGTKISGGMFGDLVVVDSLNSTGTLKADAKNTPATLFADNPKTGWTNFFGASVWPEA